MTVYIPTPTTALNALQISKELIMTTNKDEWNGHAPQTLLLTRLNYIAVGDTLACNEVHIDELQEHDVVKVRDWSILEVAK